MTGLTDEQQRKVADLATRKAELDRRWAVAHEATKQAMRARGEPVREDFPNRSAYRAAAAKFRRGGTA